MDSSPSISTFPERELSVDERLSNLQSRINNLKFLLEKIPPSTASGAETPGDRRVLTTIGVVAGNDRKQTRI